MIINQNDLQSPELKKLKLLSKKLLQNFL